MTQAQLTPQLRWLTKLQQIHRPFFVSGVVTVILALFFLAGIFLDSRYITGAPAWLKPLKFSLSIIIYTFTMLWFLSLIDTTKRWRSRMVTILGWVFVITFTAEWVAIITQTIRGTTSHFNVATPFDAALWGIMAVAIMVLFIANFFVAALLLTQRFSNPVITWGLRLAMLITIVGLGQGYLMTSPTALQMAGWQGGEPISIIGAHSVGVPDGGPGLPVLNWSTTGGDLRVGHFIGMHALQIIPFIAWFISRRRRLRAAQQVRLIWTAALGYLGLVILVTWQALRAEPLIAPSSLTLSVLAGLVAVTLISTVLIISPARQAKGSPV
jgi:hypothetical protein